jgi:hypothetical protein
MKSGMEKKAKDWEALIIGSSRMARLSWEIRKELRVPPGDVETMDKARGSELFNSSGTV